MLRPLQELYTIPWLFVLCMSGFIGAALSGLLRILLLEYEGGHPDNIISMDVNWRCGTVYLLRFLLC